MPTNTAPTQARYHETSQVHYLYRDVVFNAAAQTLSLGFVPAGATIDRSHVIVSVAFNAGTSTTATIGTRAAPAGQSTGLNLQSVGRKIDTTTEATSAVLGPFLVDTELVAVVTPAGAAATAGAARIVVTYVVANG